MLLSADSLACHKVRPSAAKSRRDARLVFIDIDLILSGFLYYFVQTVYAILAVMLFLAIHKQVHIAGLYVMHTIFLIESVS